MHKTLAELAQLVDGEVVGDKNVVIKGFSGIKEAQEGDLTFLANPKYFSMAEATKASAILVPRNFKVSRKPAIKVDNPSLAFSKITAQILSVSVNTFKGIHKSAVIFDNVKLGKNVTVGPLAVIGENAKLGDDCVIYPNTFIGAEVEIGKKSVIHANVSVYEKACIGNNVIIHSGSVIGSDGFGYESSGGVHVKIPQLGMVIVEDDVEIGANVTIDRARFDKTIIGKGTKIDNLVQIAHNVVLGENCIVISQVGISGSVKVGKNSILAGQAGVMGHLSIGENSVVAAQSAVSKSFPAKSFVGGSPARPIKENQKVSAMVQRLPIYVKRIQELEKKITVLEAKVKKQK